MASLRFLAKNVVNKRNDCSWSGCGGILTFAEKEWQEDRPCAYIFPELCSIACNYKKVSSPSKCSQLFGGVSILARTQKGQFFMQESFPINNNGSHF